MFSELMGATQEVFDWAESQNPKWDVTPGTGGEHWGCRLESHLAD